MEARSLVAGLPRCRTAAAACWYYCCWACLLLLLPIIVMLLLLLVCTTFVCSACACSRTYGSSSRELGERHASCDILRSLLRQLRLLRVLLRTAAAAAAAVCCHGFFKVGLQEAANNQRNKKGSTGSLVLASGPIRAGVRIFLGSSFSTFFFSFASFLPILKPIRFFLLQ